MKRGFQSAVLSALVGVVFVFGLNPAAAYAADAPSGAGASPLASGTVPDGELAAAGDSPARYAGEAARSAFTDLVAGQWYMTEGLGDGATYLDYVIGRGIMSGYAGTALFGPDDTLTRAMAATIIYRAETGRTAADTDNDVAAGFPDVARKAWYAAAVRWASRQGIVTGYADTGAFGPDDPVTREQLATMLARYSGWLSSGGEPIDPGAGVPAARETAFASLDGVSSVSGWAKAGMVWCTANGVMSGVGGASLAPAWTATRAQMAKMAAVVFSGRCSAPLYVHFIDVGQGDSEFLEFPGGKTMLVDAGGADSAGRVASYVSSLGYERIDVVVATSPDADHAGGLAAVLSGFDVGEVWAPDAPAGAGALGDFLDAAAAEGLEVNVAEAGKEIDVGAGCAASIVAPRAGLPPGDSADRSVVLKVTHADDCILLAGDSPKETLASVGGTGVDLLKVSDHGSDAGTDASLAKQLSPKFAVVSYGAGNGDGCPAEAVVDALAGAGSAVYGTAVSGDVTGVSFGRSVRVVCSKSGPISAPAAEPPVAEGTYTVQTGTDGWGALDVAGGSAADGANVQQFLANGAAAQQWRFAYDAASGAYTVTSVLSGKRLAVAGGSAADGANVVQAAPDGSDAQKWLLAQDGDGVRLQNYKSGKFLDVAWGSASDGANVQQWAGNGSAGQRFTLRPAGWKVPLDTEYQQTLYRARLEVNSCTSGTMSKADKLWASFCHVRDDFPEYNPRIPHYTGGGWELMYANDIFQGRGGNCISFAAAFAFMAKAIGYQDVYAINTGGHGWAEVDNRVYDPEWSMHNFSYSYYGMEYGAPSDVNYAGNRYVPARVRI